MNQNPYEPPHVPAGYVPYPNSAKATRTPFILAAVGAWAASAYWALYTLLVGIGVAMGSGSPIAALAPIVLIVLYAMRGFQLIKGDPAAIQRILWLHAVGGAMAIFQMIGQDSTLVVALNGIKVAIHIFGGAAAIYAKRSFDRELMAYRG